MEEKIKKLDKSYYFEIQPRNRGKIEYIRNNLKNDVDTKKKV